MIFPETITLQKYSLDFQLHVANMKHTKMALKF